MNSPREEGPQTPRGGLPRIAIVVPGIEEGGGVPSVARFLVRALRNSGRYLPDLISLPMASNDPLSTRLRAPSSWFRGPRVQEADWEGERVLHVGCRGSELEFQHFRPRAALTRLLRQADLVQIVCGSPAWALVARACGRPVGLQVATLTADERRPEWTHGTAPVRFWRHTMRAITTRAEPGALRVADAVFVENARMRDHVSTLVDEARVHFAPPGVDTREFSPERSDPAEVPSGLGPIVSVARFADPRKRIDLLFEAYRALSDHLAEPPPRLVLAGVSSPDGSAWELAERLGIRERVEFRGAVAQSELPALYRSASLYVQSSDEEGLGISILEAMACGLPVVSTDCVGPRTSVLEGRTGFLVPTGDANALALRMARLLSDRPLRTRLGKSARERIEEHFSIEAASKPFLAWYDRALAAQSGSAHASSACSSNANPVDRQVARR